MKKLIALLLAVLMVMTMFAGCATDDAATTTAGKGTVADDTKAPVNNDEPDNNNPPEGAKEFTIAVPSNDKAPVWAERWIFQKYEEKTGIHINWVEVPSSATDERKNLMMLSDTEKPDAFFNITFGASDLIKYGSTGAFVNLNDYPDAWPNLKQVLTEDMKGGMGAVTLPDGGIYGFPNIYITATNPWGPSARIWTPQAWLDALNMEKPTSIDELTAYFQGIKENDVNGNGDPDDEWPIYVSPGALGWAYEITLCGAYGIGDHGKKPLDQYYVIRDDGTLEFLYTTEEYKAIWQQEAEWWDAGYIHPDTFAGYEYETWTTNAVNGQVGSFVWVGADYAYSGAEKDYTYILNLSSDMSDGCLAWIDYDVRSLGFATITDACEDPATLISWFDYFYSDEGEIFNLYGLEGETYTIDEEGHIRYIDEIVNFEQGGQLGSFQYGLFTYGNFPHIGPDEATFKYAVGEDELAATYAAYAEEIQPYLPSDPVPGMNATEAEADELSAIETDLGTVITEARMNFVTGVWNFEEDWDNFVETCNSMGADRFIEIRTEQYNRYLESVG